MIAAAHNSLRELCARQNPAYRLIRHFVLHFPLGSAPFKRLANSAKAAKTNPGLSDGCAPGSQHLGYGPGLGDAAARREGSFPVEDFAQRSQTQRGSLHAQWFEEALRGLAIAVDA